MTNVDSSKNDIIQASKQLRSFYRMIFDEPDDSFSGNGRKYLGKKTGFGRMKTCMLCIAVDNNCSKCIWKIEKGCVNTNYIAISKSKNMDELKHHLSERIAMIDHRIYLFENFYKR